MTDSLSAWVTGYVILAAVALSACAPAPVKIDPPTVVIVGCEHFKLISASRKDTTETRTQILAHNAEFLKVCPLKK